MLAAGTLALPGSAHAQDGRPLDAAERAAIVAFGPWPPAPVRDPANPASGTGPGIALGEALFHSTRLAPAGGVRCASCHEPWRRFADGRRVALGVAPGSRNTPSLLDAAWQSRFGWDGATSALADQCLRPLHDPREMPASVAHVAALLRADVAWRARVGAVFGDPAALDDAALLHDAGLALAAYVETLASPRTPFDDWRDAVVAGTPSSALPPDALRGLRLFVGRGGCVECHRGPRLGDGQLRASLIRPAVGGDDDVPSHRVRTPGLRGAAATAPYMHDGRVAMLCDAARPHALRADGTPPPALDARERADVAAFLRTLVDGTPASSCD